MCPRLLHHADYIWDIRRDSLPGITLPVILAYAKHLASAQQQAFLFGLVSVETLDEARTLSADMNIAIVGVEGLPGCLYAALPCTKTAGKGPDEAVDVRLRRPGAQEALEEVPVDPFSLEIRIHASFTQTEHT